MNTMLVPPVAIVAAAAGGAIVFVWWRTRQRPSKPKTSRQHAFDPLDRSGSFAVKHELSPCPGGLQMWVADMELACCPSIVRAIAERALHPNYGYTIQPGIAWDSVGAWLVKRQNWPAAPLPSEFVFSASVVTSFCNVLRALTDVGDGVLVMTPLYAPLQRAVTGCGRRLVQHKLVFRDRCALGHQEWASYQMDPTTRLAQQLDGDPGIKVVVLCNPHNPCGRVWRRAELAALAEQCAKRRLIVIADEIWADWVLPSGCPWPFVPFTSVASPVGCMHLVLGAPTKSFSLAGLHASYLIIADEQLRRRYLDYAEPAFLTFGSTFATTALVSAYTEDAAAWLDAAKAHVTANLHCLCGYLAKHVPSLTVYPLEATYCVWIDCSAMRWSHEELSVRMRRAGLAVALGREFDDSGASDHFIRINLACARSLVELAAERLRVAVEMVWCKSL